MQDTNERRGRDPWHWQRWAGERRVGNATRKMILMVLAAKAESDTGYCYGSQADLAHLAECSERSVRTHVKALVDAGLIARRHEYKRGGGRLADGFMLLDGSPTHWPDGQPVAEGIQADSAEGHSGDPDAPLRQELLPPNSPSSTTLSAREARDRAFTDKQALRLTHKRKKVPEPVARLAVKCLDYYGERSGQPVQRWRPDGAPTENLKRVIGALLDHPEVEGPRWRATIDAVLTSPWWEGPPSVGVVFGPRVVEQNLTALRGAASSARGGGKSEREARTERRLAAARGAS